MEGVGVGEREVLEGAGERQVMEGVGDAGKRGVMEGGVGCSFYITTVLVPIYKQ